MKNGFPVSFVRKGIVGGSLTVTDDSVVFHTNKVMISDFVIQHHEVKEVIENKFLIFPSVLFKMKDGQEHQFVVFFNRDRLMKCLKELGV